MWLSCMRQRQERPECDTSRNLERELSSANAEGKQTSDNNCTRARRTVVYQRLMHHPAEDRHEPSRQNVRTQQRLCCSAVCCGRTDALASPGDAECKGNHYRLR